MFSALSGFKPTIPLGWGEYTNYLMFCGVEYFVLLRFNTVLRHSMFDGVLLENITESEVPHKKCCHGKHFQYKT